MVYVVSIPKMLFLFLSNFCDLIIFTQMEIFELTCMMTNFNLYASHNTLQNAQLLVILI